ncbi:Inosine-5'-monophosphate dehydrogenase [Methanosarcina siciliae C2J]|uniref:Inosine-5'-monophosphate dehydrogenase n=3 Tax=Methanosarcina siciliae TaxID=38027 RepID=A0A0E3L9R0_9EURY|nr:CBS domain-containing protein [Methanosarcina siciliae]AKB30706.1 Inosine-5'-monophosphate dehydrogenase [Methanosarcina siciliae HI350]AKB34608.1 Inosine-5'-monophosphate dehydrogenase [Methanosarcina siciliae C2J]
MQAKDIMVQPHKIDKSDTISHALDLMEKKDTKRLLVVHDNQVLGVLTMRGLTEQLGTRRKQSKPASSLHVATAVSDNFVKVLPDTDTKDVLTLMKKSGGVIIVTNNGNAMGWVTPQEFMETNHFTGFAGEVMEKNPIIVNPSDRVSHARRLILDNNVGRLPVVENGKLVGIIAEEDIASAMRSFRDLVADNQQDSRIKNLLVGDIMTRSVVSVYTNTPLSDAVTTMLEQNLGGVPVLNLEEELVGFLARRNIINTIEE